LSYFNPAAMAQARRGRGLTQDELARMLGRPVRTVESWERAERMPNLDNLERLARALRITVEDLQNTDREPLTAA
jgi:transcriptional regulator with XRE-family HTH domain